MSECVGEGGGLDKRWWAVIFCSPVRCEWSGQCSTTGKGSGQGRSASVSGVIGSNGWCTHSEVCVRACVRACVHMKRKLTVL